MNKVQKTKVTGFLEWTSAFLIFFPVLAEAIRLYFYRSYSIFFMTLFLAIFLGIACVIRKGLYVVPKKRLFMLLIWISVFLITILNNGDLHVGNYEPTICLFVGVVFFLFVVSHEFFDYKKIFWVITILTLIQLLFGYYFLVDKGMLLQFGRTVFGLSEGVWYNKFLSCVNSGYFMGLTTHYSTSGMYMALGTVLFGNLLLFGKKRNEKYSIHMLILFLVCFIALVLTAKRAHLLFTIIALLGSYFVGFIHGNIVKRIKQVLFIIFVVTATVYILAQIPAFSTTVSRFVMGGTANELSSGRIETLWIPALEAFSEKPLLGIGWRQFKYDYPQFQVGTGYVNNDCHNIFIQVLCETGIFGFYIIAIMIYTFVITFRHLNIIKHDEDNENYFPILFSFSYQVFFLLYGMTGNPLYDEACLYPYLLSCGLIYRNYFK